MANQSDKRVVWVLIQFALTLVARQAVYNMLKHDWTILLFYQYCCIMLTVLLRDC